MTARKIFVPVLALVAALALAACSKTVDSGDLESQLVDQYGAGNENVTADCPDDEKAEEGNTFTCTLTDEQSDQTLDVEVTMTDDDGHFEAKPVVDGGSSDSGSGDTTDTTGG